MSKKTHICLDFGNQNLKIGVFEKKGKVLCLTSSHVEKINLPIGESFIESCPELTLKIMDILSKMNIKSRSSLFYISLPNELTFCRLLKLPLVDRTKIDQLVIYEAQQQVPFSLEEVVWGYEVLGSPDPEHLHVLITAIRHEYIQALISNFSKNHLEIKLVESSMISSYHCLSQVNPDSKGTTALLNLGAHSTSFIIVRPHTVWIRSIPIGGEHLTREIQKEMKLGLDEAESLKIGKANLTLEESGISELDQKLNSILDPLVKRLSTELARSINYYNSEIDKNPVLKIFLVGGGAQIKGLDSFLSHKLSTSIEHLNAAKNISITGELQSPIYFYADIMGLSHSIARTTYTGINLLPKSYLGRQAMAKKKEYFVASILVVLVILGVQTIYNRALVHLEKSKLSNVQAFEMELKNYADQIKYFTQQTEVYSNEILEIKKMVKEKLLWIKIFEELQHMIPSNIWLDKLTTSYIQKSDDPSARRSKGAPPGAILLTLHCKTTGTYKDASSLRDLLEKSSLFQGAQIRSANPPLQGIRDFVVQIEIED